MPIHPDFTRTPIDALRFIAGTPKQGEPEPNDPSYRQNWEDEMGKYAIEALHEVIDVARKALKIADAGSSITTSGDETVPAGMLEVWVVTTCYPGETEPARPSLFATKGRGGGLSRRNGPEGLGASKPRGR